MWYSSKYTEGDISREKDMKSIFIQFCEDAQMEIDINPYLSGKWQLRWCVDNGVDNMGQWLINITCI